MHLFVQSYLTKGGNKQWAWHWQIHYIRTVSNCGKYLQRMLLMVKATKDVNYFQRTMCAFLSSSGWKQMFQLGVTGCCDRYYLWRSSFSLISWNLVLTKNLRTYISKKSSVSIFFPLDNFTIHTKVLYVGKQLRYLASVMSCLNLVKCVHSSQLLNHMGISLNKISAEIKQNITQCLEQIKFR